MKLLLLLIIPILAFTSITRAAYAVTITPTTTPSPSISTSQKNESLVQQINELKDKIASRVAQLKLVEKKGIVGTVTEVSDTRITMTDANNQIKLIDVDDITKFSSPSAKETFGISDVQKGATLSVEGLYNKQSKHILARYVSTFTLPTFLSGKISAVNEADFTITVASTKNVTTIIDIENTTRISTYADGKITRSGFSRLGVGDRIEVVGYQNKDEKNRITGSYILQLNDLSPQSASPSASAQ